MSPECPVMITVSFEHLNRDTCRQYFFLVLNRRLIAPFLLSTCNKKHMKLLSECFRIQLYFCIIHLIVPDHKTTGKDACPAEQFRIGKYDSLRLHASHGKPC